MAEPATVQRATYPLPVYNFRVTVNGQTIAFAEASGLAMEREKVTYRHGFSFAEGELLATPRLPKWTTLTLRRGVAPGGTQLRDWFRDAGPRPIDIGLCDERGEPIVQWKVARAVPTRLQAPAFAAASNEVAIEVLELMVNGVEIEHR